jgi:NDP-sugar pyrophosphorylase family protein
MLPWDGVAAINRQHREIGADITFGVTSHITERTTDVGKIIVEEGTDRFLWGYGRAEEPPSHPGTRNLTSAPSHVIAIERFTELCDAYQEAHPERASEPLSLRDDMLPWIRQNGGFDVRAFDIEGEVLDLGTPATIQYGQENWRKYVTDSLSD